MNEEWPELKTGILAITGTLAPRKVLRVRRRKPWFTHGVHRILQRRNAVWARYVASGVHSKFLNCKLLRNKAVKVIREVKASF